METILKHEIKTCCFNLRCSLSQDIFTAHVSPWPHTCLIKMGKKTKSNNHTIAAVTRPQIPITPGGPSTLTQVGFDTGKCWQNDSSWECKRKGEANVTCGNVCECNGCAPLWGYLAPPPSFLPSVPSACGGLLFLSRRGRLQAVAAGVVLGSYSWFSSNCYLSPVLATPPHQFPCSLLL